MTAQSSQNRLYLYVAISIIGAAQNGSSVHFGLNWETISYFLAIIAAGLVAVRAYIDKSPTEVDKPKQ